MERSYFQGAILRQVRELLTDGNIPLPHLQAISQEALDVSGNDHISNEEIVAFLERYPEVSSQLLVTLEAEDRDARSAAMEQIRKLLDQQKTS
ncbi:MAG: hypothetical protein KIH65_001945 [Candidatus Uhrbacteria bacterium]|nr:hypothetical protein [Candidatus Uhrbacteria bacterium]